MKHFSLLIVTLICLGCRADDVVSIPALNVYTVRFTVHSSARKTYITYVNAIFTTTAQTITSSDFVAWQAYYGGATISLSATAIEEGDSVTAVRVSMYVNG